MARRKVVESPKRDAWADYMADVREAALTGNAWNRATIRPNDHVQRPSGYAVVVRSFGVPRCGDTWALDFPDGRFSLAGYGYPMVVAR